MPETDNIAAAADQWLSEFERALAAADDARLQTLFHAQSHWRDVLAFTWRITTIESRDAILRELKTHAAGTRPSGFQIDPKRTPPRQVTRAGTEAIEAIFEFETAQGRCDGVLRLTAETSGTMRAWTLHTALDELKGHEETDPLAQSEGKAYSRDFHGPNWLDDRKTAAAYVDRDPEVLVVGGGHAGLSIAARLGQLRIDTLIVDRMERVGDNWRKRYHALVLHNQKIANHLPYIPFPPTWPVYIPKDKLAGWFESYAQNMELNFWTSTDFEGGRYDDSTGRWSVTVRKMDGSKRTMHPKHVVMATSVSGTPVMPEIPTLKSFKGPVIHSSGYTTGEPWRGKSVLIIGSGTSGHDIAQDLHACGAKATILQRSPTMVINVEPSAQLPYTLYAEGLPLEDSDIITTSVPLSLARKSHIALTQQAKAMDQPLLDALESKGFKLDYGDDGTGWQFKYLTRGGGYYFNVGCSDLIISGEVGLAQFSDIAEFVAEGARMRDGRTLPADLIVLATGYKGQEHMVRDLFGDAIAKRVGPIWGFGEEQELRNMFQRTPQPGLWFIAGSFAQCRIYSKYLGLQIKASELGMLG